MKIDNYGVALNSQYYNLAMNATEATLSHTTEEFANEESSQVDKVALSSTNDNRASLELSRELSKGVLKNLSGDSQRLIGDRVEIKGDRVYFLGRDSGAINVGGNKVQPEEVENVLVNSNHVHAAFVYAKKSPMMGSIACADIVLSDNTVDTKIAKSEILKFCREKLENFKVPAIVKFVDELNTTHSGKLKRN